MFEILFHEQDKANGEQKEQKRGFVKLGRVDGVRQVGELHAEETVRFLAVATAREKATDASERVRDQDRARGHGQHLVQLGFITLSENRVDNQEASYTADQTADKGNPPAEVEPRFRVFDIVISRLKERRRAEAYDDRGDRVIEDEIDEFFLDFLFLAVVEDHAEAGENTHRDHKPVHIEKTKYFIG